MATDNPGWRLVSQTPDPGGAAGPSWRKAKDANASPRGKSVRVKMGLAWIAFLVATAGLIYVATWVAPAPPVGLILLGATYEQNANWPTNVAGRSTLQGLAEFAQGKVGQADRNLFRLSPQGIGELRKDASWDRDLARVGEGTVCFVISAHGGVDEQGPFLLPNEGNLTPSPVNRLRIEQILERLEKLPAAQKKVLILDVTQMSSHWPLGMLHNDFARGLQKLDERIRKNPNLTILCSTSPDQRSWVSHEWGQTIFGHYLREGLRGAADRDPDQRISAFEIYQYTGKMADGWARLNRSAKQTTMLLPLGEEGESRAKAVVLALGQRDFQPLQAEQLPTWNLPKSLQSAWENWRTLRNASPVPEVHAPHAWKQYEFALLQLEQSHRLGNAEAAAKLEERLKALETQIRQAPQVALRSLPSSLALPSVVGGGGFTVDEPTEQLFKSIWEGAEETGKKAWLEYLKSVKDPAEIPRRTLSHLVLERIAQEPTALAKGAARLQWLRDVETAPPAEAHWLVLWNRDLPANPPPAEFVEILPQAIRLRQLAEQIAVSHPKQGPAYSEAIYPWIAKPLFEADKLRQYGQDWMLSGAAKDWQQARQYFVQAETQYRDLHRQAEILQNAYRTRDRLLARLPAYSQWLANKPIPVGAKPFIVDPKLDDAVLSLWKETHQLLHLLDRHSLDQSVEIMKQTATLDKDFAQLEGRFDAYLQTLTAAKAVALDEAQQLWLETEAALAVAQPNIARRFDLVQRQHRLSRRLLVESANATAGSGDPRRARIDGFEDQVRRQAQRHGRLAVAQLGQEYLDHDLKPRDENYVQLQRRLDVFLVEEKWFDSLAQAGNQIGGRFRRMITDIQQAYTPNPKAELAQIRAGFQTADRLGRQLPGNVRGPSKLDPVAEFRRWQLSEFCHGQAQRAWQEHLFDDNPTAEPYYRVVSRGFLTDARALAKNHKVADWDNAISALEKQLQLPGELVIVDTTLQTRSPTGQLLADNVQIAQATSEQSLDRTYRLTISNGKDLVPAGFPVVWVEGFKGVRPVDPTERQRLVIGQNPSKWELDKAEPIRTRLVGPSIQQSEEKPGEAPVVERTRVTMQGLFRGQIIRRDTRVEIYPQAEQTVREFPLPEKASVAVRTQKEVTQKLGSNTSGIVFVLDCSGSMGAPPNTDFKKSRYHQALESFREVLKKLPRGTTVSVWVFGQAVGVEKTANRVDETIQQVMTPRRWDPEGQKETDQLISTLSGFEPWNQSPILRAILAARDDLKDVKGFKTILAITDGGDGTFARDKALNSRFPTVGDALENVFSKGDVSLNLVSFPPANDNERKLLEEFKVVEKFNAAGKIYFVDDVPKLAETVEIVLRQRMNYWVDRQGRNTASEGVPESGLDISTGDSNFRWFGQGLEPGGHKVRINEPHRIERDVLLHRGDLLLLDLVQAGKGMAFERFLFSDEYPNKRRADNPAKDWRVTLMQNQLLGKNSLQMLLTMEKTINRSESIVEQIRPREVWVEVSPPPELGQQVAARWNYLAGYPAPAWAIDVPNWPSLPGGSAPARPIVRAWWNPDEEAKTAADLPMAPLLREKNRPIAVRNESNVVLESLQVEKHKVETRPGTFDVVDCLVVRLRYDKDRPIVVRMDEVQSFGAEHRLYSQAGKYTGLFWLAPGKTWNDPAVLESARLRFIPIAQFKEEARQRNYWVELNDLDAPEPTEFRPRVPLELK